MANALPGSLEIIPITHALNATVCVPGSKSLTNRALLVAALAKGITRLENGLFSQDTQYFAESLRKLGFDIYADSGSSSYLINGLDGHIPAGQAELFVGNAGTAARFLTSLLTLAQGKFTVDGDARMRERPIEDLVIALNQLGARVSSSNGFLPVQVNAAGLPGGVASISGNVSSQFLSGLLMVAPYARARIELRVENGLNSRPYVDMTLGIMSDFGLNPGREGYERFVIEPSRYVSPGQYSIESDATAASYFFAAAAILGGSVRVENITQTSKQGDIAFLDVLQQMGCVVESGPGFIQVTRPGQLVGIDADMRDISDTAQTLAVLAPFADSPTNIRGIGFIRAKETDRISAVCTELTRLGVGVQEQPDGITIHPAKSIRAGCIRTYNDHRMAMAFSLIGLREPGVAIENPACVSKTFPNYFEVLEKLR